MAWLQIALTVVAALVVLVVASVKAYALGRESGDRDRDMAQGRDPQSLFGPGVNAREAEQGLIDVMPDEVIVCDASGSVRCASHSPANVDIIENGRIVKDELLDILHVVAAHDGNVDGADSAGSDVAGYDADGNAVSPVREREVRVSLDLTRMSNAISGRGVTAGKPAPSDSYLRVRVGRICDGLYAVFINDVTEQRRFETMRRDFVTNVSHELKTPAGAISLLAETVSDAADDPKAVKYFAGRITKESARLTELVKHLIELQRAQSSSAMLDAQRISVMSVVREAVSENIVQADSKHIAIRLSLRGHEVARQAEQEAAESRAAAAVGDAEPDDEATICVEPPDVFIMADRETITSAVKNLVENAIRYSPEHTTVVVSVTVSADGKSVTIRVIDQGIGIPAASLDRVFERFYRVDPARSRATGGSGLGLAITKHCVQECGGTISVWSREGEGSTFTIELPTAPEQDGEQDGEASA
ncbi:sensor histidine kinase [Bifidobacterium leontopitheci]|uniref:Sensor-like histidine kinase SenX3 n=1 Tax=Bifidobacterium leontopitheci TaxID=2650774 RepID=A0A6I1GDK2_9BIFI|nr:ATP-binding protein [Bifidobacterium leontopitheci]KAB7789740.1 histidine kinase [Bifidobacterium leontopitheci]